MNGARLRFRIRVAVCFAGPSLLTFVVWALCVLPAALSADVADADGGSQSPPAPPPRRKLKRIRSQCAAELGLVVPKETAVAYARHSQTLCNTSSAWAEKNGNVHEVLGFVAPWLDHGYKAARYVRTRLTSVSPLWFRILPSKDVKPSSAYEIAGLQIAREQDAWKAQVTAGDTEILPHFSIEGFSKLDALKAILEEPQELAAEIAVLCEVRKFDGIVFDIRLALFRSLKPLIPRLTRALAQALHGAQRRLFLSVPALLATAGSTGPDFDAQDAAAVAGDVDAIIIGTRDYTRGSSLGPSAPLPWMRASVQRLLGKGTNGLRREQLLVEIPLYGRAFAEGKEDGGKVILTGEIAKALAKQKPKLVWDNEAREHSANITSKGDRVGLSFPTLSFVAERLQLASSLGVGVALRDMGSGLDYAFDLLPLRSQEDFDNLDDDSNPTPPADIGADTPSSQKGSEL